MDDTLPVIDRREMPDRRKAGRHPMAPERRRSVRVTIAVTTQVADAIFLYAQRKREPVSVALNRLLERLAQREQELGSQVDHRTL